MAEPFSINQELLEEFADCHVRIEAVSGRIEGILHGVSRNDEGLRLTVGPAIQDERNPRFETIEERDIRSIAGESDEGFVSLFPIEGEAVEDEPAEPTEEPAVVEGAESEVPAGAEAGDGTAEVPASDDGGEDAGDAAAAETAPEATASTGEVTGQGFEPADPGQPMTGESTNFEQQEAAASKSKEKRRRGKK